MKISVTTAVHVKGFDSFPEKLRQRLKSSLKAEALAIASDARARAAAHIHLYGKKPGAYLGSIYGGATADAKKVMGWVRSGSPLAHLMEGGANRPAHEEYPKAGDVLAFYPDAAAVFARHVSIPANRMSPFPAIVPAFEAAKGDIDGAMRDALAQAVA